jgi:RNA polymerase sigma-70 factor (ECF subfamily)
MGNKDLPHHRTRNEEVKRLSDLRSSSIQTIREQAEQDLFNLLFRPCAGFAFGIVRNREDAEDAAINVFIKEFRNPRYDASKGWSFTSFVFARVAQECIDIVRAAHPAESLDEHGHVDFAERLAYEQEILETLIAKDDGEHLDAAIAQLPDEERRLLIWRMTDELTLDEIAALLGLRRASAVSARLEKIIKTLQKQLRKGGVHV